MKSFLFALVLVASLPFVALGFLGAMILFGLSLGYGLALSALEKIS